MLCNRKQKNYLRARLSCQILQKIQQIISGFETKRINKRETFEIFLFQIGENLRMLLVLGIFHFLPKIHRWLSNLAAKEY